MDQLIATDNARRVRVLSRTDDTTSTSLRETFTVSYTSDLCHNYTAILRQVTFLSLIIHRLVGLVVRRPPRDRKIPGSNPAGAGIFSGSSHTSDFKIGTPVLPCQAPGVIGSALGLVGPVSVYCDWVRWKVWSATSISVWQHVKLSGQIRP